MEKPLAKRHIFTIALPNFGQDLMRGPGEVIIQGIYATYFGLDLATLATILLVSKLFDAITDPTVGLLSDRYYHRNGTRKPWLAVGTALSLGGMWLLYHPSGEVDALQFAFFYLMTYLGWTLAEIPYAAWKAEVTHNYESRTHIAAMDSVMGMLGGLSFTLIPIVMSQMGAIDGVAHTPATIHVTALIVVAVLPILVFITLVRVPDGKPLARQARPTLRETYTAVRGNGPVMYFIMLATLAGLTSGLNGSLSYLYLVRYLDAADLFVYMPLVLLPVMIAAIPLAAWAANRFGKQRVWAMSLALLAMSAVTIDLMVDHSDPNNAHLYSRPALLICFAAISMVMAINLVASKAMIGDMVDYGLWRFRANHAGIYVTAIALASKITMAVAASLGLLIVSWFGFDAANEAEITAQGALGLRLVYTWIPFGLTLFIIPLFFFYPLTRRRHATIVKALHRRGQRELGGQGSADPRLNPNSGERPVGEVKSLPES